MIIEEYKNKIADPFSLLFKLKKLNSLSFIIISEFKIFNPPIELLSIIFKLPKKEFVIFKLFESIKNILSNFFLKI